MTFSFQFQSLHVQNMCSFFREPKGERDGGGEAEADMDRFLPVQVCGPFFEPQLRHVW